MPDSKQFQMERSTTIAASPTDVYARIADFKAWRAWSPWEDVDPELSRTYSENTAGPGATYEWSGNRKAGAGKMTITESTAPSHVTVELNFFKPFKATNVVEFTLTEAGDDTHVRWLMHGPKTFGTRIMGLFGGMDKIVGKDFEKGLAQLKAASEGAKTA